MNKLLVFFVAVCFAQLAIAAGPADVVSTGNSVKSPEEAAAAVNTREDGKPATAFASTVSAPVQLTDAEMDKVVAGWGFLMTPSSGEFKYMSHLGGNKVSRVISTRGAYLVFNPYGSF